MAENKFFSKNVKYLRKSRALTLAELATKLGYGSHATVQKWESGATTPPTEVIERLCDLYHVTADQLLRTDIQKTDAARTAAGVANDWEIGRTIILGSSDVDAVLADLDDPQHEHHYPKSKELMEAERRYEAYGDKATQAVMEYSEPIEDQKGRLAAKIIKNPGATVMLDLFLRLSKDDQASVYSFAKALANSE